MKKIFLLSIILFLSCSKEQKLIYYSYKDVTITRVDFENEIYFYYGKFENNNLPSQFVKATFSGFDGGMGAYLIFEENDKSTEIIPVYDSFIKKGVSDKFILNEGMDNIEFNEWREKINGKFNNIVQLSNIIDSEKKWNLENNSKVNVIY
ncbi:hypothetical protein [Tenacibaculum finnmarkense]|uniref:hypothetical protein n=1 Tax=Tenacibaculum finnmarkense TaxID=2781243 RepID=UPI001E44DE2D|nr:hypothetical protein [Tenacibaculum finnmarkense]MCD8413256.1 hypothetical protein [Tenacibaculum finnmarkense genomovar ulcerans]MCG8208228.1 hypothetical protein [Tenacibaculum finnmarkense genomovar finnmarkense]MCG8724210.1 hypothetical protein [Tenacibaculum finnmarkense]MCG8742544.1 hypothetical protein [Tenacibaculum finnmarkense]MCG8765952.1 hypothetical protein [Tenacibaculum finnmarkense]